MKTNKPVDLDILDNYLRVLHAKYRAAMRVVRAADRWYKSDREWDYAQPPVAEALRKAVAAWRKGKKR